MSFLKVTFCGAARTVTGSLYKLEYTDKNGKPFNFILDAGMFQVGGRASLYRVNSYLVFDPKTIDAMVLTHGHLDHCGRIPYLFKMGMDCPIFCTPATADIAEVVMRDAARMQKNDEGKLPQEYLDMEYFQKESYKKKFEEGKGEVSQLEKIKEKFVEGDGYLKLYSDENVTQAVTKMIQYDYHKKFKIHPEIEVEFFDAGHIIGSAYVVFNFLEHNKRVVFSGDLGNIDKPIIEDPEVPPIIDNLAAIFTETTYGNKIHGTKQPKLKLQEAIDPILKNGNKVFIPSFSVERAQEVIYFLYELMEEKKIPYVPVYLDSPMAQKVVDICIEHENLYDDEMEKKESMKRNPFTWKNLKVLESKGESKSINHIQKPIIIIAGSGMMTGGRILKHVAMNAKNPDHLLMFCGYQAEGTLGRKIMDGATEIEIDGEVIPFAMQKINITEFSAHADRLTLEKWLKDMYNGKDTPILFLMHGEADAVTFYQDIINKDIPNLRTYWPKFSETVEIF
ncbi:MAG: MBL fold metallo-hydrolase [Patescibacteria group bacterium]